MRFKSKASRFPSDGIRSSTPFKRNLQPILKEKSEYKDIIKAIEHQLNNYRDYNGILDFDQNTFRVSELPDGYQFMAKSTRTQTLKSSFNHIRGHPTGKNYSTTNEFAPHLYWLRTQHMTGEPCYCHLCTGPRGVATYTSDQLVKPVPNFVNQEDSDSEGRLSISLEDITSYVPFVKIKIKRYLDISEATLPISNIDTNKSNAQNEATKKPQEEPSPRKKRGRKSARIGEGSQGENSTSNSDANANTKPIAKPIAKPMAKAKTKAKLKHKYNDGKSGSEYEGNDYYVRENKKKNKDENETGNREGDEDSDSEQMSINLVPIRRVVGFKIKFWTGVKVESIPIIPIPELVLIGDAIGNLPAIEV
ncbi:hypothetical protein J3Q64DRAFT_1775491 [Phycomyces blakesleeanus]|uniref:Cryptic loci regulator 2 N-terminal domain-containing protein n=2 Tax=Phycomyces blakesleeanus TaxID=4837 RepID=A0A167LYZ9_PHYB8|nr:hypothetical protein PHYBLDRAFT_78387 [Phycomyces blakesleeanus NRRL 1555(-)]OAD71379.1 hypothetical protein PHYBLDRAFT_78387 [Phycomyces blakesleeanus NRRL 1555(-)]|eukprot:XP_018289419.1 hypothetical protein PHYBLDRAFT_78387 [Phycomyces blakesleeanus NRRL 1555(-)]